MVEENQNSKNENWELIIFLVFSKKTIIQKINKKINLVISPPLPTEEL